MTANLKILVLEDNENDADLLHRELKKSGLSFISETVQTREEFENALHHFIPDIILSDYSLPAFDAVTAFGIKQHKWPHIPFIIVSGIIGEENAVELIKNGVTDYTPKDKLFTLPPKINRALKDTAERKEKLITAEKLKIQAAELMIANKELLQQNEEKEKQAADLFILTGDLKLQKEALRKANDDLQRLNQHLENRVLERTSELETLNHELKDLSTSKDKFLSVISHDLRNPLTTLLLASDELNSYSDNPDFDPIKPVVEIIHRSSHNILQQLNELVHWAQKQKEKIMFNPEKIHLHSAVDDSFELLKAYATQKNIQFANKVAPDIYVNADALMLRSILQNLVTNAIKYSLNGGEVIVTAEPVGNLIEVCVIDAGIGMDPHTKKNLFSKSHASSIAGTNNEKGSGLGLILVKDFVTQLGGSLRVESEIAKGACVYFTVPGV